MELVHQLLHDAEPLGLELLVGGEPGLDRAAVLGGVHVLLVGVVQLGVLGVVAVVGHALVGAVAVAALVGGPPAEGGAQVLCQAKGHVVLIRGGFPQGADILAGADVHGVEGVDFRIVVEEVVMMHGLGHKVAGAGPVVQIHQLVGVEVLGLPQGADVLVAELGRVPVVAHVVQVLGAALDVHVAGVPIAEHGHALGAPVAPDAELHIPEPLRALVRPEGIEGCFKPLAHVPTPLSA